MTFKARSKLSSILLMSSVTMAIALLAAGLVTGQPTVDSMVLKRIKEIADAKTELEKMPPESVVVHPKPQDPGDDFWSGMLEVTKVNNPLVTKKCRDNAVAKAVATIGGPANAAAHAEPHEREWEEILRSDRKVSITAYLDHVVHCTDFCGPLVGSLLQCHIDGVQSHELRILTFDKGVPHSGSFQFPASDLAQINEFARRMRAANKAILLEARASILNTRESYSYNLDLSSRRATVTMTALIAGGFPARDIMVKNLCWEPPRLMIRENAGAYRLQELWSRLPNSQYLDQSVVLIGYDKPSSS